MRIGIGRFDNSRIVEANGTETINALMTSAGFTKAENEVIQDLNGTEYDGTETVEEGSSYYLVQRTKSGY